MLFTPRVGALHGYALLWAMVVAVALKWFVKREVGRFAVCTGQTLLQGFRDVPGPAKWAIWIILVPQLFVAVSAIAGLAGGAATAIILVLPGSPALWMTVSVLASTGLVIKGGYHVVERAATIIGVTVAIALRPSRVTTVMTAIPTAWTGCPARMRCGPSSTSGIGPATTSYRTS